MYTWVLLSSKLYTSLTEAFKKREIENKNTKIYTGSPFHKGYVQSFANLQRVPLNRSPSSVQYNTNTLAPSKSTLHLATHNLLHPTVAIKPCRTLLHNPNYKHSSIWESNSQLKITKPIQFATTPLAIQVLSRVVQNK